MKFLHLLLYLLLPLAAASVVAATPGMPTGSETSVPSGQAADLERLSKAWMTAMLDHDQARLETMMAPDFILYTPGSPYPETPRARWLDNLLNHLDIRHWEQSDITAHVYGTIGVVTSTYHWAGTMHERTFDVRGYCTDVWRSTDPGWQVVSRTCMEFPDAAAQDDDKPA